MNSAIERLLSLRVSDVMSRKVVAVRAEQSMSQAAHALLEHGISGVPVVDADMKCVGVISSADFVRREARLHTADAAAPFGEGRLGGGQMFLDLGDLVSDHMSPAVQTVTVDTSLIQAARMMCGGHMHRLVVLDAGAHPVGILTSLDIVAAMIHAVEE